ncbi:MAG: hypothetical protein NC548_28915 [Lachnospiraceae bacterium]|nr:hypothetical protein [Lachnospiraceae bacterium]
MVDDNRMDVHLFIQYNVIHGKGNMTDIFGKWHYTASPERDGSYGKEYFVKNVMRPAQAMISSLAEGCVIGSSYSSFFQDFLNLIRENIITNSGRQIAVVLTHYISARLNYGLDKFREYCNLADNIRGIEIISLGMQEQDASIEVLNDPNIIDTQLLQSVSTIPEWSCIYDYDGILFLFEFIRQEACRYCRKLPKRIFRRIVALLGCALGMIELVSWIFYLFCK